MAEKINEFTLSERGGARGKYSWDEWFDGSIWRLTEDDFDGKFKYFAHRIRLAAKTRGLKVSVRVDGREGVVELQCLGKAEENGEAAPAPTPRKRGKKDAHS